MWRSRQMLYEFVFYEESYGSGKCLKGKYESNPKAKTYCDEFHIK